MIIYKATNTINGKYYIGKTTTTLEKRIKAHKIASSKKKWVFYNAINKYGFDSFKWEVLAECADIESLNNLEIKLIEENTDGYNIAKGGTGGDTFTNNPNKEVLRENVSKFHKNKTLSEDHKNKIRGAHKGMEKPWAAETAKKMSQANIGVESKLKNTHLSEEHKLKIGKGNKGKKKVFTEEHKEALKKAKKGFKNPNKGKTYEEIMGVEEAKAFKQRQSEMRKGRKLNKNKK